MFKSDWLKRGHCGAPRRAGLLDIVGMDAGETSPAHGLLDRLAGEAVPVRLRLGEGAGGVRRPDDSSASLHQGAEAFLPLLGRALGALARRDVGDHHADPVARSPAPRLSERVEAGLEVSGLVLTQVAGRLDVDVGDGPTAIDDLTELRLQRVPQLRHDLPDAHARRGAQRAFAHFGERAVDMPDAQGAIEESKADRGVLQHAFEERLTDAMLATASDSDEPEHPEGQDETDHRGATQQVVRGAVALGRGDALVSGLLQACDLNADAVHQCLADVRLDVVDARCRSGCSVGFDPSRGFADPIFDEVRQWLRLGAAERHDGVQVRCHGGEAGAVGGEVLVLAGDDETTLTGFDVLEGGEEAFRSDDQRVVMPRSRVELAVAQVPPGYDGERRDQHCGSEPPEPSQAVPQADLVASSFIYNFGHGSSFSPSSPVLGRQRGSFWWPVWSLVGGSAVYLA